MLLLIISCCYFTFCYFIVSRNINIYMTYMLTYMKLTQSIFKVLFKLSQNIHIHWIPQSTERHKRFLLRYFRSANTARKIVIAFNSVILMSYGTLFSLCFVCMFGCVCMCLYIICVCFEYTEIVYVLNTQCFDCQKF